MDLLRLILMAVILMHGIAHIGGFLAAFTKLSKGYSLEYPSMIFRETYLNKGFGKVFGILWLVAFILFLGSFVGVIIHSEWIVSTLIIGSVCSLVAIIPWLHTVPVGARLGVVVDVFFIVALNSNNYPVFYTTLTS